jgi:hypothetical protein
VSRYFLFMLHALLSLPPTVGHFFLCNIFKTKVLLQESIKGNYF